MLNSHGKFNTLRAAEGRKYTLLDTPLITGFHRTVEEFVR